MFSEVAKEHLHDHLRWARDALVWKLDGLSDYDVRRPMTATGTNLLGLVKHVAIWDSRYLGEVFDRPFPEALPRWDDASARGTDHWARIDECRSDIVGLYERVCAHTDATIDALALDDLGYVPWWDEKIPLFNVMLHCLSDTTRHAGHADILRESIDGAVGFERGASPGHGRDAGFWSERRQMIEQVAKAASADGPSPPT
jgi:hypothetical protein